MKRSLIIASLLALALSACGEKPAEKKPAAAPAPAPAPQVTAPAPAAPAPAPAPAAEMKKDEMKKEEKK